MNTLTAQSAAGVVRNSFEWGRIQTAADWLFPGLGLAALLALSWWIYRRDAARLSRPAAWGLLALRAATLAGLTAVYLEPQWRVERELVRNSQVVLLVDGSLSMGLRDAHDTADGGSTTRAEQVAAVLTESELLADLRRRHDVVVARFDETVQTVVTLPRLGEANDASLTKNEKHEPAADVEPLPEAVDWRTTLEPRGVETRLGQSLRQTLEQRKAEPLSAVVVISDGNQNAGVGAAVAIQAAQAQKVPLYAVGVGSDQRPRNVRVAQLVGPARAYPGDTYTVTGYVQADGLAGQQAVIELRSRAASADADAAGEIEATQPSALGADGQLIPVRFDLSPREAGVRTLTLRIVAKTPDQNPSDDQQQIDVEVVDRKTRVLLLAGGPCREYQFLRNLLFRDKDMELDLWLQSGAGTISQEAHEILTELPADGEALAKYDCLLAIDPDWTRVPEESLKALERWVADEAGGLVVTAGPVHTNRWAFDSAAAKLRTLYPVEFGRPWSLPTDDVAPAEQAAPLQLTRDGLQADFLWLADNAADSQRAWARFTGVYGAFPVQGAKPGATVYAQAPEPGGGEPAVYWAGQFYGSGRVFYAGSSEMWRLRRVDDAYFEQFFTKLVRHVSQGRWLRGASRGTLLVERERYLIGQPVQVQAQLKDAQMKPLAAEQAPLTVVLPDGTAESAPLTADRNRPGEFRGQFTPRREGTYRLQLDVPQSDGERLVRRVQVELPDLERQSPQRNDATLAELARETDGTYYVGLQAALGAGNLPPLVDRLADRTQKLTLTGTPIPLWDNAYVMLALCGLLALEWLCRRLLKLA